MKEYYYSYKKSSVNIALEQYIYRKCRFVRT